MIESKGFIKGTLINSKNGPIEIENLRVGDYVLTHNKNYQKIIKINNFQLIGNYRLQVQGSPATFVDGNTFFYVRSRKMKWNNELKISERSFSNPIWKKAKDLTKDDFILIAKNNKAKNTYELTEDDCWLFAKFMIKGYVSFKDKNVVIIYGNKNKKEEFDKHLKNYNSENTFTTSYYKCTIKNKNLYDICMLFNKNNTIIPSELCTLPDKLLISFLQSYTDDAGIFNDEYFIIKDFNKKLIYQLGLLVSNINSYGGFSLFMDSCQKTSYRIQYKDNIPKSSNFVRLNNSLWQPVREIVEISAYRGDSYSIITEYDNSYSANNLICK